MRLELTSSTWMFDIDFVVTFDIEVTCFGYDQTWDEPAGAPEFEIHEVTIRRDTNYKIREPESRVTGAQEAFLIAHCEADIIEQVNETACEERYARKSLRRRMSYVSCEDTP
jgi:hypothetical protein